MESVSTPAPDPEEPVNKNRRGRYANSAERIKRVDFCLKLLIQGYQRREIVQKCSDLDWNVGERQIDQYLSRAREIIAKEFGCDREQAVAEHVAMRREIYRDARDEKNHHEALALLSDEAKLRGLYPATADAKEYAKHAALVDARVQELETLLRASQAEVTRLTTELHAYRSGKPLSTDPSAPESTPPAVEPRPGS
jgi:hypothetical protein